MTRNLIILTPELIAKFCAKEIDSRYLANHFGCAQTSICRALHNLNDPDVNRVMLNNVPENLKKLSDISTAKYPDIDRMILDGEKVDYISFVLKVSAYTVTKRRKVLGLEGVKGKDIKAQKSLKEIALA